MIIKGTKSQYWGVVLANEVLVRNELETHKTINALAISLICPPQNCDESSLLKTSPIERCRGAKLELMNLPACWTAFVVLKWTCCGRNNIKGLESCEPMNGNANLPARYAHLDNAYIMSIGVANWSLICFNTHYTKNSQNTNKQTNEMSVKVLGPMRDLGIVV